MNEESKILVEERALVIPGNILAVGNYKPGTGTYRENNKIIASKIGLVSTKGRIVSVIPLRGRYIPRVGDTVIGKIVDIEIKHALVDINSPMLGILPLKIPGEYKVGDTVKAKILSFDGISYPLLTTRGRGLGKVRSGALLTVEPTKIPRIIGKKGSMINMIKTMLECSITLGQNGKIIIFTEDPQKVKLLEAVIRKIEREAHVSGLSDRIKKMLEEKTGKKLGDENVIPNREET